jgi:hypothetical protein
MDRSFHLVRLPLALRLVITLISDECFMPTDQLLPRKVREGCGRGENFDNTDGG